MVSAGSSVRLDPRKLLGLAVLFGSISLILTIPREPSTTTYPALVVDPNTAPPQVLAALPHLGPARVSAIEAARSVAPFGSVEDLDRRVKGFGPLTAGELRPFLRFDPSPTSAP